jgi:hypothetical protein
MVVVLVVVDHVRRGEAVERRRVRMETRRHHGRDWWKSSVRSCLHHESLSRQQPGGLNGGGSKAMVALAGQVRSGGWRRRRWVLTAAEGARRVKRCQKDMQMVVQRCSFDHCGTWEQYSFVSASTPVLSGRPRGIAQSCQCSGSQDANTG